LGSVKLAGQPGLGGDIVFAPAGGALLPGRLRTLFARQYLAQQFAPDPGIPEPVLRNGHVRLVQRQVDPVAVGQRHHALLVGATVQRHGRIDLQRRARCAAAVRQRRQALQIVLVAHPGRFLAGQVGFQALDLVRTQLHKGAKAADGR